MEKKIKEIAKLKENWDGYGARPIYPEVIENTRTFLNTIGERNDLEKDDITPTPYGSICIEFPKVSVEIGIHKIGWFALFDIDNISEGEDTDFLSIPEKLKELL